MNGATLEFAKTDCADGNGCERIAAGMRGCCDVTAQQVFARHAGLPTGYALLDNCECCSAVARKKGFQVNVVRSSGLGLGHSISVTGIRLFAPFSVQHKSG